jgi:CRISPR-associated protein Csb2
MGREDAVDVVLFSPRMRLRWTEFKRWRSSGSRPAVSEGYGFRITFSEEVAGPIALGYASHFGLGLFIPEISDSDG